MAADSDDWENELIEIKKDLTKQYIIIYDDSDTAFSKSARDLESKFLCYDVIILDNSLENFKYALTPQAGITHAVVHYIGHGVSNSSRFPGFPLKNKPKDVTLPAEGLLRRAKIHPYPIKLIFDCCNIGVDENFSDICTVLGSFDFFFDDTRVVLCSARAGQPGYFFSQQYTLFNIAFLSSLINSKDFIRMSCFINNELLKHYEDFKYQITHPSIIYLYDLMADREIDVVTDDATHDYYGLTHKVFREEMEKMVTRLSGMMPRVQTSNSMSAD